MSNTKDNANREHLHGKEDCIIALKVLDQCKFRCCAELGPIISDENCECFIDVCENGFGRMILPCKPICLPKQVATVKINFNSFKTKNIRIIDITPSKLKCGFWDINLGFVFDFDLMLFDEQMNPIRIFCCPYIEYKEKSECAKYSIRCSAIYFKQVTLYGSNEETPFVASDLFVETEKFCKNAPHVMVESLAYLVDSKLKSPDESCCHDNIFDDVYCEPINYVFISIVINASAKLFHLVSLDIDSSDICTPKWCIDDDKPCSAFQGIKFPDGLFKP